MPSNCEIAYGKKFVPVKLSLVMMNALLLSFPNRLICFQEKTTDLKLEYTWKKRTKDNIIGIRKIRTRSYFLICVFSSDFLLFCELIIMRPVRFIIIYGVK